MENEMDFSGLTDEYTMYWFVYAFSGRSEWIPNQEMFRLLSWLDLNMAKPVNTAQFKEAEERFADLPAYPAEGSIVDAGEYVVIMIN